MNPVTQLIIGGVAFLVCALLLDILCEEVWRPLKPKFMRSLFGRKKRNDDDDNKPQHDSEVKRWRKLRTAFALTFAAICFFLPLFLMRLALQDIDPRLNQLMVFVSLYIMWHFVSDVLPKISVYVPEGQGLLTLNQFTKKFVIYGQGFSFRFPWETVHEKNHISLQDLTIQVRKISIPTKGAKIYLSFQFSWKPRLSDLDVFFQIGGNMAEGVSERFRAIFEEFFTSQIRRIPAEVASNGQMILSWLARSVFDIDQDEINLDDPKIRKIYERMSKYVTLDGQQGALRNTRRARERKFGVDMNTVEITDFDFDRDVQEARNAIDILRKMGPAMRKSMGISQEAWEKTYVNPDDPGAHQRYLELFQQFTVITKDAKSTIVAIQGGSNQGDPLVRAALAELAAKSPDPVFQAAFAQLLAAMK
ncbi:MAG: SPFH domain-containing protein [Patescibacteria group bacterium]